MKKIIASILLCISFLTNYAQLVPATYQQARDLYNRLAYSEAIPLLFKECTGKNNKFLEAHIMLADCYRQTNQYALAEAEYAIVNQDVRLKDEKQRLYYAQILQINQKYAEAATWYTKYLAKFPNDNRAKNQFEACSNIQQFYTDDRYSITSLPFNTNGYDFGTYINNNLLYYTSTGGKVADAKFKSKDINLWTGEHFMDLYSVGIIENDSTADDYSFPSLLPKSVNTKYNEGTLCFNKANTKVYFTRNPYNPEDSKKMTYSKEKEANLTIYEATIENGKWININKLPFNNKQYSCGHPALDEEDSTLYFASNMPGGFGGVDLWKVKFANDKWEKPVNLGATINTEGDEMFPALDKDKTLYFSSDGLGGLGGLDIFSAKISDNELSVPHNLGTPLNSSYDDFGFLINENKTIGFLSSDRPGGKGEDDIYRFSKIKYQLEILIIDKFTKEPIATSQISADSAGIKLNSNSQGISSTEVEGGMTYDLLAAAPDYFPTTATKLIPKNEKKPNNNIVIELQPIVMQVMVIDAVTKKPLEAATINTTSPCVNNSLTHLTDAAGKASFFVKNKCKYSIQASARSYLPKAPTEITTTLKDTIFVLIELEQVSDKPIVLNNIYYDFDKWNIRSEAETDLNLLLQFLKDNPEADIELSSHTDARGDDTYNQELSQKRAQSAVNWLVARGVNANNIKPVGYGESKPVNQCVNNIKCTEEQHQRNRRTEFRVLNAGQVIASQVKQDIIINPCNNCPF